MCWYQGITEKVKAQLSGWAASSLSMAGRAVLVNLAESLEEEGGGGERVCKNFFFFYGGRAIQVPNQRSTRQARALICDLR